MTTASSTSQSVFTLPARDEHGVVRADHRVRCLHEEDRLGGGRVPGLAPRGLVVQPDAHDLADPGHRRADAQPGRVERGQLAGRGGGADPRQRRVVGEQRSVDVRHKARQVPQDSRPRRAARGVPPPPFRHAAASSVQLPWSRVGPGRSGPADGGGHRGLADRPRTSVQSARPRSRTGPLLSGSNDVLGAPPPDCGPASAAGRDRGNRPWPGSCRELPWRGPPAAVPRGSSARLTGPPAAAPGAAAGRRSPDAPSAGTGAGARRRCPRRGRLPLRAVFIAAGAASPCRGRLPRGRRPPRWPRPAPRVRGRGPGAAAPARTPSRSSS